MTFNLSTTKHDLTLLGSFMFMGLIDIIITSLFNVFLQNLVILFTISLFGIFIFIALVAWDIQKFKTIYYRAKLGARQKLAILGALTIYLYVINLFSHLLSFE